MSLITDGLLIATCLTAALYCFVLSKRLKKLTSTEDGIGQQILQLNSALDETRNAVKDIRNTSKAASERLAREVQNAKRSAAELQRLTEAAQRAMRVSYPAEPAAEELAQPKVDAPTETESVEVDDFAAEVEEVPEEAAFDGEDQLGFDPGTFEQLTDEQPVEDTESSEGVTDAPPAEQAASEDEMDAELLEEEPSARADSKNLIKVERMAL